MKRALLAVVIAALAVGYATGHAATATVSVPKCPAHAPKFSSLNGTSRHFVRTGAQVIRLCRFYKNNWADPLGLWRKKLITKSATIGNLTSAFNKLKKPPMGIFCVKDDQSEEMLWFGYAGAKPERVVIKLSGCRFATNGKATRSTTARLHKRLLALSKP